MGRSHAVFVVIPIALLPGALQISWSDGHLIHGCADDGVERNPVRTGNEKISARVDRISALRHFLQLAKVFFTAAARIGEFIALVVSNRRKETRVEKCSVVGEFRKFVAVAEPARGVRHGACEGEDISRSERLIERVNGIQIAWARLTRWKGRSNFTLETD